MTMNIILMTLIFAHAILANEEKCENVLNVGACTFIDNGVVLNIASNEKFCKRYSEFCCWDGKLCYNKFQSPSNFSLSANQTDEESIFEFPETQSSSRRILESGTPCLPPPKEFPLVCAPERDEPYVTEPPVDIPYCRRVPCSLDGVKQSELDQNRRTCGIQPGCYFDNELFRFRQAYGGSVLAGVPVCQLAIRKSTFHTHAQKVVDKYGFWNPYFTNCLLNTFKEDIDEEQPGCKLIPVLLAFKIQPKLKGWPDINTRQCRLIDGCWRPGEGCFSPVDSNQVMLKSGQAVLANIFEIRYGRPQCQHFNTENSLETVKSFHRCLSAGCTVDTIAADFYHDNLFNMGYQMSIEDHWGFWNDVMQGKISSLQDLRTMEWKRDPQVNRTASMSVKECSKTRSKDLRPCRPLRPPQIKSGSFCQYQSPNSSVLPPLKGNFKSCCDINLCYHAKNDHLNSRSGPSVYYTPWSYFTECTSSCGSGTRKRFRKCVSPDPDLCTEELESNLSCNLPPCGRWSKWSGWSKCKGNGRKGTMTKTRRCIPTNAICRGSSRKTRRCLCRSG